MIVRVQQFPVQDAETFGGWPDVGLISGIAYEWGDETGAFEIVIAEQDESGRPLSGRLRRDHLRSVIPTLAQALQQPGGTLIARLDGPCAPGELLGALQHLPACEASGRFALSPVQKLDASPGACFGSLRMEMDFQRLEMLCSDPGLNLETSVRLRLFGIAEEAAEAVLVTDETSDERWGENLAQTSFIIQPARGMEAIQVITPRFGASEFSARVTRALAGTVD
jgi:hypothetical protein